MAGKDAGLRIRIERHMREAFLDACRADDKPAAQVIREFIPAYISRHENLAKATARKPRISRKGQEQNNERS